MPNFVKMPPAQNPFRNINSLRLQSDSTSFKICVWKNPNSELPNLIFAEGDGKIRFFKNLGNLTDSIFIEKTDSLSNPFFGIYLKMFPVPFLWENSQGNIDVLFGLSDISNPILTTERSYIPTPIKYFSSSRCQPDVLCNGRGNCNVSSSATSKCQCVEDFSSGAQCASCPKGKTEPKYIGGKTLKFSLPPQCVSTIVFLMVVHV